MRLLADLIAFVQDLDDRANEAALKLDAWVNAPAGSTWGAAPAQPPVDLDELLSPWVERP